MAELLHHLYTHHSADGGLKSMNMKDLVSSVSIETNLPASQVRKVTASVLQQFAQLIETSGKFTSPTITISGIILPSKPATEEKPERPERKFGRMRIRVKKSVNASQEEN
jgi:hypothetical protein